MAIDFEALKKLGALERTEELRSAIATLQKEIAEREKSQAQAEKGKAKEHKLEKLLDELARDISSRKNELSEAQLLLTIAEEELRIEVLSKEHTPKAEAIRPQEAQKSYTITQNLLQAETPNSPQKSELENILAAQRASEAGAKNLQSVADAYKSPQKAYEHKLKEYDSKVEDSYGRKVYEAQREEQRKKEEEHVKKQRATMGASEKIEKMYEEGQQYKHN